MSSLQDSFVNAAKLGDLSGLKAALGKGVDPNHNYGAALRAAVIKGHVDVVRALVDAGADLNITGRTISTGAVLIFAAVNGHKDMVDLLLKSGATANVQGGAALARVNQKVFSYASNLSAQELQRFGEISEMLVMAGSNIAVIGGDSGYSELRTRCGLRKLQLLDTQTYGDKNAKVVKHGVA